MANKKLKIDEEREKRLKIVEKLIREYNIKADSNSTLLNEHITKFNDFMKELHDSSIRNQKDTLELNRKIEAEK